MEALAAKLDSNAAVQELGTIVERSSEGLSVVTSHGRYRAKAAFSCLVEPAPGDRVLVATTLAGEAFVLAVLERTSDEPAVLRTDRDLSVRVSEGRFTVAAPDGVDLATPKELNLVAGELGVRAKTGRLAIDALTHLGKLAHLDVEQVKGLFGLVDHVAERISQTVKRSYRFVEELDVTRAQQIDVRAESNVNVRGRNTVISAEQLVKMDAEQIHLG